MPTFEILRTYFAQPLEICPTGLIDDQDLFLLEVEQACREYYKLPFDGGLWDQPYKLIQAFAQIRQERNQYERARMEELKRDGKSKKKVPGHDPFQSPNLNLPVRNTNLSL